LRRAREERRFRQSRRPTCLFKARRPNDPERLPSILPAASRQRWVPLRLGVQSSFKVPRTLFACSRVTGRRPTTPAPGSHYPSTLEAARPTLARRATCPRVVRERCASPTSATDSLLSCTCSNRTLPEVAPRLHEPPRLSEQAPTGDSGRRALDGALRALETPGFTLDRRPPAFAGGGWFRGHGPILMGDPIESPRAAPLVVRRFLPRDRRAGVPLTPLREPASHRGAKLTPDSAFLDVSSKTPYPAAPRRLPSTNARSTPRFHAKSRARARHRMPALPPWSGFRRSFASLPREGVRG
jgi:hypothetical protein